jgi:outer membrane protein OmpA-like peptidoglycan-associated protein
MKNKWLLLVVAGLLLVGLFPFSAYAKSSYFGVKNQAVGYPSEFDQTDKCINDAEQSPGAKYCPDKIAQAREMAKQGVETYWSCRTKEGLAMLAQACKLANEARGCGPVAAKQPAPARTPIEFHSVYFDFNKSDLTPDARAELDRAAKTMLDNPDVVLELAGNCDSVGSEKYNQALGERRAKAVFDYLKAKGIAGKRLEQVSHGKDKPVATNSTDAGRAKNRNVTITILK